MLSFISGSKIGFKKSARYYALNILEELDSEDEVLMLGISLVFYLHTIS